MQNYCFLSRDSIYLQFVRDSRYHYRFPDTVIAYVLIIMLTDFFLLWDLLQASPDRTAATKVSLFLLFCSSSSIMSIILFCYFAHLMEYVRHIYINSSLDGNVKKGGAFSQCRRIWAGPRRNQIQAPMFGAYYYYYYYGLSLSC